MTAPEAEALAAPILAAITAAEGPLAPKKRAVVVAALACFADKGYAATSTREIAARAGVAEATIFRHFATKAELLDRMVRPLMAALVTPALGEIDAARTAHPEDFEAMLRQVLRARLAMADRFAPLVRILLQELPVNPGLRAALGDTLVPGVMAQIGRMLAVEVAAGRMRPAPVAQVMRTVISAAVGYWVASRMLMPGAWDDAAETAAIAAHLVRGYRPG